MTQHQHNYNFHIKHVQCTLYNYYKCLAKNIFRGCFLLSLQTLRNVSHTKCVKESGYIYIECLLYKMLCTILLYIIKLSHYDLCYSTWCVLLLFSKATRYGGCGVIIIIISGVHQKKRLEFVNELGNRIPTPSYFL